MSGGDKILSENYFQHADHFMRILNDQDSKRRGKIVEKPLENDDQVISEIKNEKIEEQSEKN